MQEWNGIPGQWWFGGGTDITPSYLNEEDMRHFHGTYKVTSAIPFHSSSKFVMHKLAGSACTHDVLTHALRLYGCSVEIGSSMHVLHFSSTLRGRAL